MSRMKFFFIAREGSRNGWGSAEGGLRLEYTHNGSPTRATPVSFPFLNSGAPLEFASSGRGDVLVGLKTKRSMVMISGLSTSPAVGWLVALMLSMGLMGGCSHGDKTGDGKETDLGPGMKETVNGNEIVKAFDLNGDNKPDAFEYYVRDKDEAGKPIEKLVRKEFDLNFDGKVDFWRWYDEKENVMKESSDTDFNGKIDITDYFEKSQRVKEERDFDAQGVPHTVVFYDKGQVVRKEKNKRGPDHPDYYEYWENGVIDRIGIDRKDTGTVDFWERNPDTQQDK